MRLACPCGVARTLSSADKIADIIPVSALKALEKAGPAVERPTPLWFGDGQELVFPLLQRLF